MDINHMEKSVKFGESFKRNIVIKMGKFAKQFCVNFSRVNIPCVTILEYTSTCYLRIIVLPFSN